MKRSIGLGLLFSALLATAAMAAPQYGDAGFELSNRDLSTKPGDDFFQYANGTWLKNTPIPGDKSAVSLRLAMSDLTEQRLHDLLEAASASAPHKPGTLEGKVGAYYKSFMDEAHVEALGATPLKAGIDTIRAAKSRSDIAALMGRNNADFENALAYLYIDVDLKNPDVYAIYLTQGGLGLPDRDYYLSKDFEKEKAAYESHAATLLSLIGWKDTKDAAAKIVALETKIADASWTRAQQRDLSNTYNPMSVDALLQYAPGFDWRAYMKGMKLGDASRVIVAEKSAFPKIAAIFGSADLDTLKAWVAYHFADNASPYLSKAFADAWFDLHGKVLGGQKEQKLRWKRGVQVVAGGDFLTGERLNYFGNMGWGVGELFAAKYFPPSAKAKIEELVQNLKAAYRVRIQNLDWMGPETKKEALEKLETYNIKVGYPDNPRDYSSLVILDDDPLGNAQRSAALEWAYHASKLGKPVDKSEWFMTPQTNDAYNGSLRDIVFPAGILQAPMFDADADPAYNYGAIGGVIGHELTHGFDDQGRKIDAKGALRDWWTETDGKEFEARASKLGAQYSSYEPLPGLHIKGELTMGENIADAGGLTLALDAYHASLHGKPAPVVDGYTGDQRVFLGWAEAWCGRYTDDAIRQQVVSDPHSYRKFRVNGVVVNIDAWYAAFGVKPGNKMYLAPKDRVHIW